MLTKIAHFLKNMIYNKNAADVAFLRGDYLVAAQMYYEGARDGDELASFNYAYMCLVGLGVPRDPKEAKSFFSFAKNMKGGESLYNLACMYLEGDGVPKNYKKALEYMTDAADSGCIEAQLYMGMAHTLGYMLYPDIVRICMIPCHTAEYRDASVPLLMGDIEDEEKDEELRYSTVRADARQAFEYFKMAAHHNPTYVADLVAKGQFLYAKCYIDGLGVDFDMNKGLKIMLLAGKSGSEDAKDFLVSNGVSEQMLLDSAKKYRK